MAIDPTDRDGAGERVSRPLRVLVAGASGYIGRHVVRELAARGHRVIGLLRPRPGAAAADTNVDAMLHDAELRFAEVTRRETLAPVLQGESGVDAVISCIASRGGGIADSWAVDYQANRNLLGAATEAGVRRFVLLSAICVQRPELAFQQAKAAFERELRESGLDWTIVRPTAFFKSLAGQVPRVLAGKPFLLLGPGDGPACKPIAEADLAAFLADCLTDPGMSDRVLPIGGPGPATTVRERAEMLFELAGRPPRFRRAPLALLRAAEVGFSALGRLVPRFEDQAEFARIGRYYATQSMLVFDERTGRYDADATPEYGERTLRQFYRRVLTDGLAGQELGDHAMF